MSLADWVEKHVRPGGRASKLGQLIENALSEECSGRRNEAQRPLPAQQFCQTQPKTLNSTKQSPTSAIISAAATTRFRPFWAKSSSESRFRRGRR